jgi:sugar lactone lactonase YvrE
MSRCEVAVNAHAELGEGPVWDAAEACLCFVDVHRQTVHRFDPVDGALASQEVGHAVGSAIPRLDGGLVLGLADGIHLAEWGESETRLIMPIVGAHDPTVRLNDAKCDPRGRLWAGSMATDFRPGVSTLYRFGPQGAVPVVVNCALANGMGWSPAGDLMYFVDSRTRIITAFDYDIDACELSGRRTWMVVPEAAGYADGMAVDADGGVWVAMYLGSAVHRYDPDGALTDVIELPVRKVTSVCFGGQDLTDLYITTARAGLTADELIEQPHAGDVFVVPGAGYGQPSIRFDPATIGGLGAAGPAGSGRDDPDRQTRRNL